MDERLLEIFTGELQTQCRFIVIGAHLVNRGLQGGSQAEPIWFALQGILVSAANASKLLWGSKSADDLSARQPLRDEAQVDNHSPLYPRQLRNDFEHFDERLEAWFSREGGHAYFGRNIWGAGAVELPLNHDPGNVFGHFDPGLAIVSFWEHSVVLNDLIREADRILKLLSPV